MAAHTPGPWHYEESDYGHDIRLWPEEEGSKSRYPAHTRIDYEHDVHPEDGDGSQYREAEANARLIAAAPELYEAASKALAVLRHEQAENGLLVEVECDMLERAIEQAGGSDG